MSENFIKEQDFEKFLEAMIGTQTVVGPIAKRKKFTFEKLEAASDLRLDYDVTLLPPKKEMFPVRQPLVKFDGGKYEGCINPEQKILFGVHFYDMKAIDQLDYLFTENNEDINYTANRNAMTIVCSNIQNVSKRGFWGSVGTESSAKGHDAFITKIKDGYVFDALTDKGSALLKFGTFSKATGAQMSSAKETNEAVMDKCPEKLKHSSKEIAAKVRASFSDDKLWEEQAHDCFSCGSCNTVCPTCYCFDVQDKWNLDQVSGTRTRTWDACLTVDFAKVSLGGGHTENFRDTRGERFRHRIMRKTTYLNERLGSPACVGCGRCSAACTSDIADPANIVNKIMEA